MMKPRAPVDRDYKNHSIDRDNIPRSGRRTHFRWYLLWFIVLSTGFSLVAINSSATAERESNALLASLQDSGDSPGAVAEPAAPVEPALDWQEVKVKNGYSLSIIFDKMKISPVILHEIMTGDEQAGRLKNIRPGDTLRFGIEDGQLQALHYLSGPTYRLEIERGDDGFIYAETTKEYEVRTQVAGATINDSLFLDAQKAGMSERITMELAHIFGWDIDFALDIRRGDRFSLVYEELWLDGEKVRDGEVLAAEFINDNQVYRALRYTDPNGNVGYFSPEGKNVKKAFLRTPVDFTRISSRFGKRKHPIRNKMRMHKGVDYAAPRGTPVHSTAKGKIVFRGRKGGYGRVVIVQHGTGYRTLYAHLNSFHRGQRVGSTVQQGQVIGFVGSSGLATGPHLHYEFLVNGSHRNPLRVKTPDGKPVDPTLWTDFRSKTMGLLALLDIVANNSRVAMNQTDQ